MLHAQPTDNSNNTATKKNNKMTFGGGTHDRQNSARADKAYVQRQLYHQDAQYLVFDPDFRILFDPVRNLPVLYSRPRADHLLAANNNDDDNINDDISASPLLFLGTDDEERPFCAMKTSTDVYNITITTTTTIDTTSSENSRSSSSFFFVSLREVASLLPAPMSALAAHARSLYAFHKTHLYCGTCGAPTVSDHGGARRRCSTSSSTDGEGCKSVWYPRIDPAVIMLILHPTQDSVLLCRQPRYPPGMYSCLAGHMEHAEHIEDTVRRETLEETDVRLSPLDPVRFFRSQPWPFPHTLMLGCVARAASTHIYIDGEELVDARWFTREEIQNMADARQAAFKTVKKSHRHYRPRSPNTHAAEGGENKNITTTSNKIDPDAERHGAAIPDTSGDGHEKNGHDEEEDGGTTIKFFPPSMAIAGEMLEAYLARDPIFDFPHPSDDGNGNGLPGKAASRHISRPL